MNKLSTKQLIAIFLVLVAVMSILATSPAWSHDRKIIIIETDDNYRPHRRHYPFRFRQHHHTHRERHANPGASIFGFIGGMALGAIITESAKQPKIPNCRDGYLMIHGDKICRQ